MDIFEAFRKDHDIQCDLLNKLIQTSGDSEERNLIYRKLKRELTHHANGEERYFYIPLIKDEITQDKARHGITEHQEIDELIKKLDRTAMNSPSWISTVKELNRKVTHHLADEEKVFFQLGGKVILEKEKSKLGENHHQYMVENRLI
jgi:hemerythrin superfamily protein